MQSKGSFHRCWWEHKMVWPRWKTVWQFLTTLDTVLPYDPAIVLLDIYPADMKLDVHVKPVHEFYKSLFTIAKDRKQPRRPSIVKWRNKLQNIRRGILLHD